MDISCVRDSGSWGLWNFPIFGKCAMTQPNVYSFPFGKGTEGASLGLLKPDNTLGEQDSTGPSNCSQLRATCHSTTKICTGHCLWHALKRMTNKRAVNISTHSSRSQENYNLTAWLFILLMLLKTVNKNSKVVNFLFVLYLIRILLFNCK